MKKYSLALVIFFHALFLTLLAFFKPQLNDKKVPQKIVVTTFSEGSSLAAIFDEIEAEEIIFEPTPEPISEPVAAIVEPQEEEIVEKEIPQEIEKVVEEVVQEAPPPPKKEPKAKQKPVVEKLKPKSKPKPKVKPTAKKTKQPEKEKKPVKKAVAKASKATPKKTSPKKTTTKKEPSNEKLVSQMKEALAQLEKGVGGSSSKGKSGKGSGKVAKIGQLQTETASEDVAIFTYEEELAIYLKSKLKLPEPGEVKIKLTLSSDGKVLALSTIQSGSEKNRSHVEERVPKIKFPSFDERLEGETKHTFSVVLRTS
jgi:outer membrane biosynthesis protein TonB